MHPCPNFRDVGATVNVFAGAPVLREGTLFRGGKIDFVDDAAQLGNPGLIVNLRRGVDPDLGVPTVHIAADDRLENYNTADPFVRRWLVRVLDALTSSNASAPVLVLTALDVPHDLIVADYLMTDGVDSDAAIRTALSGLARFASTLASYLARLANLFARA
jgi:protein-tyrosine phosphatase